MAETAPKTGNHDNLIRVEIVTTREQLIVVTVIGTRFRHTLRNG